MDRDRTGAGGLDGCGQPHEGGQGARRRAVSLEAAYRRGDLFEKRRELMVTWAAFVAASDADVIPPAPGGCQLVHIRSKIAGHPRSTIWRKVIKHAFTSFSERGKMLPYARLLSGSHLMILLRKLLAITSLILIGSTSSSQSDDIISKYVRKIDGANTVIVFVHGLFGDATSTWTNGTSYWPKMISDDPVFAGADVFVYSYPTAMWATLSPDEIADHLRLQLNARGVLDHARIIFLSHSLGGIVTRAFLLRDRDAESKTLFAFFYGTPSTGSQIASIATLLSKSPQLGKLKPMNAEDYLADQTRQWHDAGFQLPSYCAYEKQNTFGLAVVTMQSAAALCTKGLVPINTNHIDIVKPASPDSDSYLAFQVAYRHEMQVRAIGESLIPQFEAVLNALHRTQMTKSELLFPQLDAYIANPTVQNWKVVQRTASALLDSISQAVQLSLQFDSHFYEQGSKIIQVSNGARETVDKTFNQPFRKSRADWRSQTPDLQEISIEDRPTPDQARKWAAKLRAYFDDLSNEMERLLDMIRQKS
jgi:triacylglycerol esterase/lipase EstA (alpha/beta hydrolase family)